MAEIIRLNLTYYTEFLLDSTNFFPKYINFPDSSSPVNFLYTKFSEEISLSFLRCYFSYTDGLTFYEKILRGIEGANYRLLKPYEGDSLFILIMFSFPSA